MVQSILRVGVKLSKGFETSFRNAESRSAGGAEGPRRMVAPVERMLSRIRMTSGGGFGEILGRMNVTDGCL